MAFQRRDRENFGVRWQGAAATPLFGGGQSFQSGVALGFPPVWLQDEVRVMKVRGIILTALSPFP